MRTWDVKFKSYNRNDYTEVVSARDEKEARTKANKAVIRHDDRDVIMWVKECKMSGWGSY